MLKPCFGSALNVVEIVHLDPLKTGDKWLENNPEGSDHILNSDIGSDKQPRQKYYEYLLHNYMMRHICQYFVIWQRINSILMSIWPIIQRLLEGFVGRKI